MTPQPSRESAIGSQAARCGVKRCRAEKPKFTRVASVVSPNAAAVSAPRSAAVTLMVVLPGATTVVVDIVPEYRCRDNRRVSGAYRTCTLGEDLRRSLDEAPLPQRHRVRVHPVRLGDLARAFLSRARTSSTTCAFSLGVYLRLAMSTSFAPARSYPEQPRSRRSTPQQWGVQDSGAISFTHPDEGLGKL